MVGQLAQRQRQILDVRPWQKGLLDRDGLFGWWNQFFLAKGSCRPSVESGRHVFGAMISEDLGRRLLHAGFSSRPAPRARQRAHPLLQKRFESAALLDPS